MANIPKRICIPERSCDFTDYPKIFENTYWGAYNHLIECERKEETIIGLNRNNLVKLYKLYKVIVRISKKAEKQAELIINGSDIRDHIEYYKTCDNKIITIFTDDCDNHEFIIQHGYIPFEPLYSTNHKSYLKIIQ